MFDLRGVSEITLYVNAILGPACWHGPYLYASKCKTESGYICMVVSILINKLNVINLAYFTLHWTCIVILHKLHPLHVHVNNSDHWEINHTVTILT